MNSELIERNVRYNPRRKPNALGTLTHDRREQGMSPLDIRGGHGCVHTIYSNPEVMRYWSTPPLTDREAAANLIKKIQEDWKRRIILKWGIALRPDNKLIGSITLFNFDFNHRRSEIGYALGRDHWPVNAGNADVSSAFL